MFRIVMMRDVTGRGWSSPQWGHLGFPSFLRVPPHPSCYVSVSEVFVTLILLPDGRSCAVTRLPPFNRAMFPNAYNETCWITKASNYIGIWLSKYEKQICDIEVYIFINLLSKSILQWL